MFAVNSFGGVFGNLFAPLLISINTLAFQFEDFFEGLSITKSDARVEA